METRVRRYIDAPPSRVYRALVDPVAVQQWMVPDGMTSEVHAFDARGGGAFRITLTYDAGTTEVGTTTERADSFRGRFTRLVPDEEVVQVVEFETDDPAVRGEMTITYRLGVAGGGTELVAVHEDLPPGVSPADGELGWSVSISKLARLVEASTGAGEHARPHSPDAHEPVPTEQFWEEHYRQREQVWSGRANPVLVDVVQSLPPGTALDLGAGEGGDAVWLAGQGWRVTAVDVSPTALDRAAARVAAAGLADRVALEQHDLSRSFPDGRFDLVNAQYLQSPVEFPREDVLRRARDAVAPGGRLLVVGHAAFPPWASQPHPEVELPSADEVLAALELPPDQWQVERLETLEREATGPDGRLATLTDAVVAVRRTTG